MLTGNSKISGAELKAVVENAIRELPEDLRTAVTLREFDGLSYEDIADVMEIFGVQRVAGYSVRRLLTKALTVEWAARVHRVPLDEFLVTLNKAVAAKGND